MDKLEEIEVIGKSLKQVQALEEDEIESEFKKEVEKLRLDMLKLMEILQKEYDLGHDGMEWDTLGWGDC